MKNVVFIFIAVLSLGFMGAGCLDLEMSLPPDCDPIYVDCEITSVYYHPDTYAHNDERWSGLCKTKDGSKYSYTVLEPVEIGVVVEHKQCQK